VVLTLPLLTLAAACSSPTSADTASVKRIERTITTGPGNVEILAGTVTASGGFITGVSPDSVCGFVFFPPLPDSLVFSKILCQSVGASLGGGGGQILDGGAIQIDGVVNSDTVRFGSVEAKWGEGLETFTPSTSTIILTAAPAGGYHFAQYNTSTGIVTTTPKLILHGPFNGLLVHAFLQQNASTGGGGGGGGGTGGGGGGGGTCIVCPPPKG